MESCSVCGESPMLSKDTKDYLCPSCGHKGMDIGRGAYIEVGEWDGNSYELEESAQEYICPNCKYRFYETY